MRHYVHFHDYAFFNQNCSRNISFVVFLEDFNEKPFRFGQWQHDHLKPWKLFKHENFLYFDTKNSLRLITFTTFQQPLCRDWKIVELNRFKRGQKSSGGKFVEKFQTFNGCPIRIKMPVPQLKVLGYDKGRKSYHGYGLVFNEVISKSLNYTSYFMFFSVFVNKTDDHYEDFEIQTDTVHGSRTHKAPLHATHPHTTIDVIFLISRPHPQSNKMFNPFRTFTWCLLIGTFSVALLVICVMKFAGRQKREFVFGRNIDTPILNLM
jgi:hypothetical protein